MLKLVQDSSRYRLLQWNTDILIVGFVLYLPWNTGSYTLGDFSPLISKQASVPNGILPFSSITISNLFRLLTVRWIINASHSHFPYFEPYQHIPIIAYLWGQHCSDVSLLYQIKLWVILAIGYIVLSCIPTLGKDGYDYLSGLVARSPSARHNGEAVPDWPKPLIFPSRTTHARAFPQKHSFSYSYLMVGVPVGWHGASGSMVSADSRMPRAWFHVHGNDHLFRAGQGGHKDLKSKLDEYLQSQEQDPKQYPFAYLVTAPRILGYCFNPVSFWYLYSVEKELNAMILEVNNTFDERRMYLLRKTNGRGLGDHENLRPGEFQFSGSWKKDFHVSPFNSREGSYILRARDPLRNNEGEESWQINSTITLLSSKNHKKLVARIFSTSPALNPKGLGCFEKWTILASWAWVGFLTFPRILKEAWKLFFAHKLHVWFRPEVLRGSVGRQASSIEIELEGIFRQFLFDVVTKSKSMAKVRYLPPRGIADSHEYEFCSGELSSLLIEQKDREGGKEVREVMLEVLSPAFYSRFVHYAHVPEAFDREFLCTEIKNRTVAISQPGALVGIFREYEIDAAALFRSRATTFWSDNGIGYTERVAWEGLRRMRCPPATQSYPPSSSAAAQHSSGLANGSARAVQQKDIRTLPFSALDLFVMTRTTASYSLQDSPSRILSTSKTYISPKETEGANRAANEIVQAELGQRWLYIQRTVILFLAQRFAFGLEPLVRLIATIASFVAVYLGIAILETLRIHVSDYAKQLDSLETLRWALPLGWLVGLAALVVR